MASAWGDSWGGAWGDSWGVRSAEVTVPPHGTGDNAAKRRIIKPTGLQLRPKAKTPAVQKRIDDAIEIEIEVARRLAAEQQGISPALETLAETETLALRDIDARIGVLLRKKIRTDEEQLMLVLMLAALSA